MELLALRADFAPLGYITPFNIQWNRKYYTTGDFSVQMLARDYSADMAYIYAPDRPELGMVQKIEYSASDKGAFVQLSGFFAEGILDWKTLYPRCVKRGTAEAVARAAVEAYKDDLTYLTLGTAAGLGSSVELDCIGKPMGTTLAALLKTQELAQRVRYDYENNRLLYEVWSGQDRTQSQSANTWAIFSTRLATLAEPEYTADDSGYKNYFICTAGENDAISTVETLDLSGGGVKRVEYIRHNGTAEDGQTAAQFRAALQQEMREKAAALTVATELSFRVSDSDRARYRSGYDLGDVCDIVVDDIGLSMSARIIEVKEVWKAGKHTVEPVFGTGIPTIFERSRL